MVTTRVRSYNTWIVLTFNNASANVLVNRAFFSNVCSDFLCQNGGAVMVPEELSMFTNSMIDSSTIPLKLYQSLISFLIDESKTVSQRLDDIIESVYWYLFDEHIQNGFYITTRNSLSSLLDEFNNGTFTIDEVYEEARQYVERDIPRMRAHGQIYDDSDQD